MIRRATMKTILRCLVAESVRALLTTAPLALKIIAKHTLSPFRHVHTIDLGKTIRTLFNLARLSHLLRGPTSRALR